MSTKPTKETCARANAICPCGSGQNYAQCCLPYISGIKQPTTAEALMRSRYSAYTQNLEAYLLRTWHTSSRPGQLNLEQLSTVQWIGLKILTSQAGTMHDDAGIIEFITRFKENGKAVRLHETSKFVKENGHWYYLNGSETPAAY